LDKTLLNETMMNAGKLKFKKEYEDLKQTKQYPEWIAKHWSYNDEGYFPELLNNVMKVQENTLKDFIVQTFNQSAHANGLRINKIMQFIDSIPTFTQLKTEIIKKGYLRPEMMRALKLVKYLYDHGVSANRLSGTSMVYKSANKQEAIDNMKCTVTLNKYHKSP